MKCPSCLILSETSIRLNKEIERLHSLIKRFMKAQGGIARRWMLGRVDLMNELLKEVDK